MACGKVRRRFSGALLWIRHVGSWPIHGLRVRSRPCSSHQVACQGWNVSPNASCAVVVIRSGARAWVSQHCQIVAIRCIPPATIHSTIGQQLSGNVA